MEIAVSLKGWRGEALMHSILREPRVEYCSKLIDAIKKVSHAFEIQEGLLRMRIQKADYLRTLAPGCRRRKGVKLGRLSARHSSVSLNALCSSSSRSYSGPK